MPHSRAQAGPGCSPRSQAAAPGHVRRRAWCRSSRAVFALTPNVTRCSTTTSPSRTPSGVAKRGAQRSEASTALGEVGAPQTPEGRRGGTGAFASLRHTARGQDQGRRERDSNPRQAFDLRPLSKRVPSATRSSLQKISEAREGENVAAHRSGSSGIGGAGDFLDFARVFVGALEVLGIRRGRLGGEALGWAACCSVVRM
jgi:hypothetical protein